MSFFDLAWLIPVSPLVGFLCISLLKKYLTKKSAGVFGSFTVLVSFVISCGIFFTLPSEPQTIKYFDWITAGNFSAAFSFLIDPVTCVMLLIITGIGFLIHVYSVGYMKHDEAFARFFAYMNLFVFFMLILVLADNYVLMFAGWEGVGLCSYLLIGFWFKNNEYNNAANKAFIMNRIGDLGFLLGVLLVFVTFGSVTFNEVFAAAKASPVNEGVITAITMLLFVGAMGKSAQIPLYTWLPDAMAGPTPVSALIHAATMVTAGVYMVVRSNILYSLAPFTLEFITIIGAATAIFAATIALTQTDIKKVLAYSTVSQLGYMFVALGVGAFSTGLFHVTTHAFFKALLFLAAGSVIHAMGGEQDIRKMGGLRKHIPLTYFVFVIGSLAISGVPPFAGFFSKDEILARVHLHNDFIFFVLALTSVMGAFYTFRLLFLVFHGRFRGTEEQEDNIHESPWVMALPLVILAFLSTVGGLIGLPSIISESHPFNHFLAPVTNPSGAEHPEPSLFFGRMMILVSVVLLIIIYQLIKHRYSRKHYVTPMDEADFGKLFKTLYHKYYIDEIYNAIIVKPLYWLSDVFYKIVDLKIVDGIVNLTGKGVNWGSRTVRLVQNGSVGFYIFAMVVGIIAMLAFNLIK